MRLICFAVFFLTSGIAYSQTQVPNEFQAGQPAKASEVNANFDALKSAADSNSQKADDNTASVSAVADSLADATLNIAALASSVSDSGGAPAYKFVGLTSTPIASGGGKYSLLALCQSEFGANARIASFPEVYESAVIPATDYTFAWLQYGEWGSEGSCTDWTRTNSGNVHVLETATGTIVREFNNWDNHCANSWPVGCSIPW